MIGQGAVGGVFFVAVLAFFPVARAFPFAVGFGLAASVMASCTCATMESIECDVAFAPILSEDSVSLCPLFTSVFVSRDGSSSRGLSRMGRVSLSMMGRLPLFPYGGESCASSLGCGASPIKESKPQENDLGIVRFVNDTIDVCVDRVGSRERIIAKAVSLSGLGAALNSCSVPTL